MTNTNTNATHKELHEGVSGSGHTNFSVVTVRDSDGSWRYIETFDNKPEAVNWLKWA